MFTQAWRHGPSGLTYLVSTDRVGTVVKAVGPVDGDVHREAVAFHDTDAIADVLDGDLPSKFQRNPPSAVSMPQVDLDTLARAVADALRSEPVVRDALTPPREIWSDPTAPGPSSSVKTFTPPTRQTDETVEPSPATVEPPPNPVPAPTPDQPIEF